MSDVSEPARLAVPPTWAHDSVLDEDRTAVIHDREGDINFRALTGDLKTPLIEQHLRLEQIDRLRIERVGSENKAIGLVCDREDVCVILIQNEDHRQVELVSWGIDGARNLRDALNNVLDAYDTAAGE